MVGPRKPLGQRRREKRYFSRRPECASHVHWVQSYWAYFHPEQGLLGDSIEGRGQSQKAEK
jgi:hypothetical protein